MDRRVRRLSEILENTLPQCSTILDVGCGDGQISKLITTLRPEVEVTGIDVLLRPKSAIPVVKYDGITMPFETESFDVVMMVDVLHHAADARVVLAEAARVARKGLLIKDHCRDGFLAHPTLRLMDYVGNHRHGVDLPYNYWSKAEWEVGFDQLQLRTDKWTSKLDLYGVPLSWVFERSLHYVAFLAV